MVTRIDVGGANMGDGGGRFVRYLERMRPMVDAAIAGACDALGGSVADGTTADLRRYLYDPLVGFTASGGKRVRPILCLLGGEAVGGDASRVLSSAVAVELFQSAALIHDDIADDGTLRRGSPCLHVSEGVGLAVNAGDLSLVATFGSVTHDTALDADVRLAVLSELLAMAERTLEGQALDLGWARDGCWNLTVDDYCHMAIRKTAHYSVATPLVCGALCCGGTIEQCNALRDFGLRAGLAFQLQDDLLNVVGDPAAQGKNYRCDITEGKRTMLAVHALAHLGSSDAAELRMLLSSGTTDASQLDRAVALMESAGSVAYVRSYATDCAAKAAELLGHVRLASDTVAILSSMADYFVDRDR